MKLDNASDEAIEQSYRHLIELQEDVMTLDSEANGADELEAVISELSHLHSELQAEVRDRDLDDGEVVEEARDESSRDRR